MNETQLKPTNDTLVWEVVENEVFLGKVAYDELFDMYRTSKDSYTQEFLTLKEALVFLRKKD